MTATGAPPRPLHSRAFETLIENGYYRRYYLGHGVSLAGTWMQAAAVNWIVLELTDSKWWLGVVEAANLLPGLPVGLIAGALADRVVPKSMVVVTQVAQMAVAAVLALLFATGAVQLWMLIVLLAMARVGMAFEMPARQVFLYEVVGRGNLSNAIALNVGLFNASRVVGPALAGVCLAWVGRTGPFLLNAVSYLAAVAAILSIPTRATPKPKSGRGPADLLGGFDHLRRDRKIGAVFGLMAFFGIAGMGYNAMLSAYAREVIGTRELGYSVLMATGGLGAVAGALLVAVLGSRWRREDLIVAGMAIFSLAIAAAGILPHLRGTAALRWWPMAAAMLCLFGTGLGAITFYSAAQMLVQLTVPDRLRGRIMGVWMIIFSGSVPLGAVLTGWLAQRLGVEPVLVASAIVCGTTTAIVGGSGLLHRAGRSAPEVEAA